MSESSRLSIEIIKLLLQVAWADDRIEESESAQIWSMARAAGISEEDGRTLEACLAGEAPLPAPDIEFLREHKKEALAAVQRMILLDDEIARGELLVLDQIKALLGVP